jgi:hypothetical protein
MDEKNMKPEKIDKLKGILCRDIWGKVFIRAKAPDGTDRDYRVDHCDLSIIVQDDDAYAYEKDGEWILDYGPDTLGPKNSQGNCKQNKNCRTK